MAMLQLILAMIIWGTLGLFVLKSGLSSINIAFYRCLIGALMLAPFCFYKGYFVQKYFELKQLIPILLGGIFVVLNWILLFESFHYASITLGNVSYYLQPVFLLFLSRIFFKEDISPIKYFFIFLTFIGVLLTINLSSDLLFVQQRELIGVGFALLAGFFYSLATLIVKQTKNMPAPMITFLQLSIGTLILLPLSSITHIEYHLDTISYIFILGAVHTVIAFVLYYNSVSQLSTDKIAVASYVDPIAAIATDVLFFDRVLLAIQVVGIFITLISSYFVIDSRLLKKIANTCKTRSLGRKEPI
jgi:drug/metabolite transporter (DMT)-like permease